MLLKPDAPKPRIVGVRVWPRAIPQFNVGHGDQLDKAKKVCVYALCVFVFCVCVWVVMVQQGPAVQRGPRRHAGQGQEGVWLKSAAHFVLAA